MAVAQSCDNEDYRFSRSTIYGFWLLTSYLLLNFEIMRYLLLEIPTIGEQKSILAHLLEFFSQTELGYFNFWGKKLANRVLTRKTGYRTRLVRFLNNLDFTSILLILSSSLRYLVFIKLAFLHVLIGQFRSEFPVERFGGLQ